MAIGTEIIRLPVEAGLTIAALAINGHLKEIDPYASVYFLFSQIMAFFRDLEMVVDQCSDLCRNIFLSNRRRHRNMNNEAQLRLEERINDFKEEMDRLGKEITQIIVFLAVFDRKHCFRTKSWLRKSSANASRTR